MAYRRDDAGDFAAGIIATFVIIVVIALVVLVGWQVGWWFRAQDTNRQAQLDKQGIGYQQPLQTQIGDEIHDVMTLNVQLSSNQNPQEIGVLDASRKATVVRICQQAEQVNPATPLAGDQADFVKTNCYAGSIDPGSVYNH